MTGDPAARLVAAMLREGRTLGVAESLTAGLVTDAVVRVPGSSSVLRGGVTAYQVRVKEALLGVSAQTISRDGVVSASVALAMARGVRDLVRADVGIGTTGVAGPGPDGEVPAGVLVVAVVTPERAAVREWRLAGTREAVRHAAAGLAVALATHAVVG